MQLNNKFILIHMHHLRYMYRKTFQHMSLHSAPYVFGGIELQGGRGCSQIQELCNR